MQPPRAQHAERQEVVAGPNCGDPLLSRVEVPQPACFGEAVGCVIGKEGLACASTKLIIGNNPGTL